MTEVFVGIDPGLTGAIAILKDGCPVKVIDIPTREVTFMKHNKPKIRKEVSEEDLVKILFDEFSKETNKIHVVIERVSSRPNEGSTSSFRFGELYGTLKTAVVAVKVLTGLDVNKYSVFPSVWKRAFNLIGEEKYTSLELARSKYPDIANTLLKRKKDHNRAEAILLAEYIKTHKPSPQVEDDAEDE